MHLTHCTKCATVFQSTKHEAGYINYPDRTGIDMCADFKECDYNEQCPNCGTSQFMKPNIPDIKTIDVNALEWFDKAAGNSYFAATVSINYGMEDAVSFIIPFQYGHGDHYRDMAFRQLQKRGFVTTDERTSYWRYYEENNIIARHSKHENCKQRELKSLGK